MIDIEHDVPIPEPTVTNNYPFGEMKVGDSFWHSVPHKNLYNAARNYGQRHGKTFTVRSEFAGVPGARVWRVT